MRQTTIPLLAVAVLAGLALSWSGCQQVQAYDGFTLDEHDHLIAEAPGCNAECRISGKQRLCSFHDPDCHAVCKTLTECRVDGRVMKVCAVVRGRP
jgi:hypothetical protein